MGVHNFCVAVFAERKVFSVHVGTTCNFNVQFFFVKKVNSNHNMSYMESLNEPFMI